MSTHNPELIDGVANGTISKGQFLKYASGGWIACTAITDKPDGVAFSDAVDDGPVVVQIGGKVKYLVGAVTIADGALVATTAAAVGQLAVSTQFPRLRQLGTGTALSYAEALWISDVTVV